MGCDIHMYAEVKRTGHEEWEAVGKIFENPYSKLGKELITIEEDGYSWGEPYTEHPYDNRNYDLFGILADVRNGTWGEKMTPISQPKGLPKDISKYVKRRAREYGEDGHSHSWLSIEELENYNWKQKIKMRAYVPEKQARDYKKKGIKPTSYSAYSTTGVVLEWEDTIYQKVFCEKTIPALKKLKKYGQVRIVFWFDN